MEATDLSSESAKAPYNSRDIEVYAPDHQKSFRVVKDTWWVEVSGKRIDPPKEATEMLYPAEVAWSPDSGSFFITQSVGYTTGYHTEVYRISGNELVLIQVNRIVSGDFDRHHRCFDGQVGNDPNVAGFKWLSGSDRLLMVAEAPPIGICKDAEYFGGYEISLRSREIVERFSPEQLADRWGNMLGERLKSDLAYLSAKSKKALP